MNNQPMALFGSRLRTARKMAGMSLEDLSGRIGGIVTRQALYKYEKGRMMPSPEVFERLAGALGIKPSDTNAITPPVASAVEETVSLAEPADEFYIQETLSKPRFPEPSPASDIANLVSRRLFRLRRNAATAREKELALAQVRFREREKLSVKSAIALKLRVEDYVERCLEVESALGLENTFVNPLADREIRTTDEIEAGAAHVRLAWGLGSAPVTNLLGLLEEKGIRVFEVRGIKEFEGLSGNFGPVPFVTVNRDFPVDRVRFTAAHELGHILCGFAERESAESLCHAFAAAFLLPSDALKRALIPARRNVSLWELKELKENFGISLQAIMYRARALGFVTDRQLRNFRETIRAKGWLVTEPVEFRGNERATRLRRLLSYAVSETIIAPERAAVLAGVPPGEFLGELGNIF